MTPTASDRESRRIGQAKHPHIRPGFIAAASLGAITLAAALFTTAQPAATDNPADSSDVMMGAGVPTIADLFLTSPYINGTLLAMSIVAVGLFILLLLRLDTRSFTPPRFVDEVTRLIFKREFDQALTLCRNHSETFVAGVALRVIENRDQEPAVLMEIVQTEGRRRGEHIWARTGYLAEIANIAPMLGLLGTVIGMIEVFFTLTTRTVGEKAAELSGGIATAMGTTMFGLIVAIAAGLFYTLVRSRATGALTEAEQVCHAIADATHRSAAIAETAATEGRRIRKRKRSRKPRTSNDQPETNTDDNPND